VSLSGYGCLFVREQKTKKQFVGVFLIISRSVPMACRFSSAVICAAPSFKAGLFPALYWYTLERFAVNV